MGRILAIDYGEIRIGFAVSDTSHCFAFPRPSLNLATTNPNARLKAFVHHVADLVDSEEVEFIVLGCPMTLSHTASEQTGRIQSIFQMLTASLSIPVQLWDEGLSTKDARSYLQQLGTQKSKIKGQLDSFAAKMILESYLNAHKKQFEPQMDSSNGLH